MAKARNQAAYEQPTAAEMQEVSSIEPGDRSAANKDSSTPSSTESKGLADAASPGQSPLTLDAGTADDLQRVRLEDDSFLEAMDGELDDARVSEQPIPVAKAIPAIPAGTAPRPAKAIVAKRAIRTDQAGTNQAGNAPALASTSEAIHPKPAAQHQREPINQRVPIDEEERQELLESAHRKRFFLSAVPSWLISMMVHVAFILALAAISLDPVTRVMNILEASSLDSDQEVEALAQFDLQGPSIDSVDAAPMTLDAPTNDEWVATPEVNAPELFSTKDISVTQNKITESIMPSALLSSSSLAQMSTALDGRSASKGQMLARFGGTAASEAAVARALKWIAAHQAPDGGWTFAHSQVCRNACQDAGDMDTARNGATALALLPFLGAGQTHVEGQYKANIYKGLAFLIRRLEVTPGVDMAQGSWHEPGGRTYSHALAAICLCEAYAMTQDPDLLHPAQLSLNYLIKAQHVQNGGWRYSPGQPGDTSVVGWALMALKSGKMGGLAVPAYTFQRTDRFLDFVSTNNGAYYGYKEPAASLEGRQATIAVGLLCRMYMGYPKQHPGLQKGIEYIAKQGPSTSDLYFSYYATQVLRHNGGELWDKWNNKMRDRLVETQVKQGHAMGSWYESGSHTNQGGRLYTTALATMILEVYYRHMPLYSDSSLEDDFEI